jgi:hypothetical protein
MSMLSKYCPTFSRITLWLWESPTFTKWGNQGVQSLRFLLVTPLILTRFDETEIAAWYLFSSLNFMGAIITQRLGMTFSRMFAFAMGGASDLSPIKGKREQENGGQPNWEAFGRAYGTIGTLNLAIAGVNVLMAFGMGWFGLNNIIEGYEGKAVIWWAFALLQAVSFFGYIFQRYGIALTGMNYVALANRWNMVFSILSVFAGSLTLFFGGGMIALVLVMQAFAVLGILRSRYLLSAVEEGRVLKFRPYGFEKQILAWAWTPTWKGFIEQFGVQGSLRLTAIIYTSFASKQEVASFLFALANVQTITQIAQAPFSAVMPMMSKLMATGDMRSLHRIVRARTAIALGLLAAGVIGFGVMIPFALEFIESNIPYISLDAWFLLGGLTLLQRFNVLSCAVSAVGNEIIYYREAMIATVLGALTLLVLKNVWGVYTPILTSILPPLIIMNIGPLRKSAEILGHAVFSERVRDLFIILLAFLICACAAVLLLGS